ncbi:IS30 family transposase (plasmid) [Clostridium beijerinckii]|uniref:IS30 family transposase n=1 Tax=Clostridium beijerinckii TaxID=1520 RepID=A0AAX0AV46_CLOBE|nr:IS30 family transposase [Clostridium beijerinckii]NRT33825.1 IS30 family transposase [Clostridium beijerinckii]NRT36381.1 IS30 family transposase [Clostridium beijerinckii]NRT44190.1 IS30 family transposase [Clostridium beijerinckii]NRT46746.1 IS30 family transposase [Clostridium beijerinckii]NRT86716.1 IS30 family transposase [Clostridium beijerinckii]
MSKFFTYEQRLDLQKYLKESLSFKEIARRMAKDPTTISREVRKYSYEVATGYPGFPFNACRNRFNCRFKNICGKDCSRKSSIYCKLCPSCNPNCQDYIEEICTAKYHVPYVCNGCETFRKCTLMKNVYDAERAHIKAHKKISDSRSGLCVSEDEINRLNRIISPLVKNGQSVNQIYINHQDELMCSEKTIYNYIDACLFDVRNIDLPRKVKFRERYKKPEFKVDKGCRIDRNYKDFEVFINKNPDTTIVQMDSVIGIKGGKCLLTIHFVECSLMLAFLRDANTSKSVTDVFNHLDKVLGKELFLELFPVILTDNGSEFSNPKAIEYRNTHPLLRTRVFYCDASSPYQKGAIEVNHELIRRILPKGSSFNNLTQDDINLMMNHINSYKRKKLNNRSPYETFSFYHGEEVLHKLECNPVAAGNIMLKPALLKK